MNVTSPGVHEKGEQERMIQRSFYHMPLFLFAFGGGVVVFAADAVVVERVLKS